MVLLRLLVGVVLVAHVIIGLVIDSLLVFRGTRPNSEFAWIAYGEAPFGFIFFSGLSLLIGIMLIRLMLRDRN